MDFEVPEDLRYLESHEWVRVENGHVTVGITDFAQDELGDIVFVELPEEGDDIDAEDAFGVVESIKAVSDLYAPISGEVVGRNEELFDAPELVKDDPYGEGWMLQVELDDEDELDELLDADGYEAQIE